MGFKEIYEKMSNEELLEKYKKFEKYRDNAKEAMVKVLSDRKLISQEEFEKKLKSIRKYVEDKIEEVGENEEVKINKKMKNPMALSGVGKILMVLLILGAVLLTNSLLTFGYGVATLSWKETKGKIINFNSKERIVENKDGTKEKITDYYFDYLYNIDKIEYKNNYISAGSMEENHYRNNIGKNHKEGDALVVYYNPKNQRQSIVVKYSLKTSLLMIFLSIIILLLFYLGILKYEDDYDEEVSRKSIGYIFLLICGIYICAILMGEWSILLEALLFFCLIIYVVFELIKTFGEFYFLNHKK